MGHQILVELPNIEFNEPCSVILKLFQVCGRMDIRRLEQELQRNAYVPKTI